MARGQVLDTYVLPAFGSRQLRSIQPHAVRTRGAGPIAIGLVPATVRKAARLFSADLEAAGNDGLISPTLPDESICPGSGRRECAPSLPTRSASRPEPATPDSPARF
jgi:hypothetical protein